MSELQQAKLILEAEAQSILAARERLGENFISALDTITSAIKSGGKVVVTGVGKSGKVASKVAATLSSTGTLAIFLHPTEAAHGDLGMVGPKDTLLAYSHSGNSEELLRILPNIKRLGVKIVAIVGNLNSTLAAQADVVINGEVEQEACPLNLAPTSSTTVAIALGDALALCLSKRWGFREDQFAEIHPAGTLGRRLTLLVRDLMKRTQDIAWVDEDDGIDKVVSAATDKKHGAVHVSHKGMFTGIITDGDIRRSLAHRDRFFTLKARDIMTKNPTCIGPDSKAHDALKLMENRPSQISVLPVVDFQVLINNPEKFKLPCPVTQCIGLVRLHDLIGQVQ